MRRRALKFALPEARDRERTCVSPRCFLCTPAACLGATSLGATPGIVRRIVCSEFPGPNVGDDSLAFGGLLFDLKMRLDRGDVFTVTTEIKRVILVSGFQLHDARLVS